MLRCVQELTTRVKVVDDCVKRCVADCEERHKHVTRNKNEGGFVRYPLVADIILLGVIALVVWAAFASQAATNNVKDSQKVLERITYCNQYFLTETISDLNERTTFTVQQAEKNVDLQKAQSKFLAVLLVSPPVTEPERRAALERYFDTLTDFTTVSTLATEKVRANPFPSEIEVAACFDGSDIPTPEEDAPNG